MSEARALEQAEAWRQDTGTVLASVARLLDKLRDESLQLQATLGDAIETGTLPGSIYRLQSLDMHTQLQDDLGRVLAQLAADVAAGRFDPDALRRACRLPSTIDAIFTAQGSGAPVDPPKEAGAVHLF